MRESIDDFLSGCGIQWERVQRKQHQALLEEWNVVFGRPWSNMRRGRQKTGPRAMEAYLGQACDPFWILPFLNSEIGPLHLPKQGYRPAYACQGTELPDLSEFHGVEFCVVSHDWSWTMVHTHEDSGFGGPYFMRREWMGETEASTANNA